MIRPPYASDSAGKDADALHAAPQWKRMRGGRRK